MGLAFRITGNFQSCCFLYGERERRKRRFMAIWRVCMRAKSDKRYHGKLGSWIGKSGNVKEKRRYRLRKARTL